MKTAHRRTALAAVVLILGALALSAGAPGDETAKDPVCGMSVTIKGASHTAEHLGKTYYFCSAGCKAAFLKDPAKYAGEAEVPAPAAPARPCCPRCPMMAGKMAMPGPAPAAEAPPAPPAPAAHMHAAGLPECPMMKAGAPPCCPMLGRGAGPMTRMKMRHPRPMRPGDRGFGMAPGFVGADQADLKVENTDDGVIVRITSKDPEAVKLIQKHWAMRKAAREAAAAPAPKADEREE